MNHVLIKKNVLYFVATLLLLSACSDEVTQTNEQNPLTTSAKGVKGHLRQTKTFSSDVAIQWMDMQLQLMRQTTTVGNAAFSRHYAYSGITLYEAVVPGMPAYQSIASQLNGLGESPKPHPGLAYYWPASANAALAYINKHMFPHASDENKAAIDQLEQTLYAQYSNEVDPLVLDRSVEFGRAVAERVFAWSETDNYQQLNDPYSPTLVGPQYWTPPNPMPVHTLQYMGNIRRLVSDSGEGAHPAAPVYANLAAMTTEVINAKPAPDEDNYQIAFWWRDFPGTSTPGHYISILKQVLTRENSSLDVAALAYALGGIIDLDICISTWQAKFEYLLARPVAYSVVMGESFTPLLGAPHPEYPAAHASMSIANAEAMTVVFGDNYSFTDHTFEGLVTPQGITLSPRSYSSFRAAGEEAGYSRMYAGIHYRQSIEVGFWQGRKVADNIISKLRFLK